MAQHSAHAARISTPCTQLPAAVRPAVLRSEHICTSCHQHGLMCRLRGRLAGAAGASTSRGRCPTTSTSKSLTRQQITGSASAHAHSLLTILAFNHNPCQNTLNHAIMKSPSLTWHEHRQLAVRIARTHRNICTPCWRSHQTEPNAVPPIFAPT